MKDYHTRMDYEASTQKVWEALTDFDNYQEWNPLVSKITGNLTEGGIIYTTIVPLENTFAAKLLSFKANEEIVWQGKLVARFLLAGKHYYRLKSNGPNLTTLEHGEYFTGLLSHLISKKRLKKMENAFVEHNLALKKRIKNES